MDLIIRLITAAERKPSISAGNMNLSKGLDRVFPQVNVLGGGRPTDIAHEHEQNDYSQPERRNRHSYRADGPNRLVKRASSEQRGKYTRRN